jgi:hypothetical protein
VEPDNLRIHEVTLIATETGCRICEAGFDERGKWHRPDNRQHGTGIVRAVALSLLFWIPAVIWAIVHYTQKAGLPW